MQTGIPGEKSDGLQNLKISLAKVYKQNLIKEE